MTKKSTPSRGTLSELNFASPDSVVLQFPSAGAFGNAGSTRLVQRTGRVARRQVHRRDRQGCRAHQIQSRAISCRLRRCSPCEMQALSIFALFPTRRRRCVCHCLLSQQPGSPSMAGPGKAPQELIASRRQACAHGPSLRSGKSSHTRRRSALGAFIRPGAPSPKIMTSLFSP